MDSADNSNEVESSGLEDDQAGPAQNGFRVLSVAEINCAQKRKLPNWMATNEDEGAKKPKKTGTQKARNKENEVQNGSSSAINEDVGSSHQEDDSNNKPQSPSSNVDIEIEENKNDLQLDDPVQSGNCSHDENRNELDAENSAGVGESSPQNDGPVSDSAEVKEEKKEDSDDGEPSSSTAAAVANTGTTPIKKQVKVEKNEATSTTQRVCCQYGIRCYRRNPAHRVEMAHPGDPDYRLPDYPTPPIGTPSCPYGIKCYRRNPVHFQDYSHPPSTDPEKNWKRRLRQLKKKRIADKNKNSQNAADDDEEDDYDVEDPFIDDGSVSEYSPSESEYDDESDE